MTFASPETILTITLRRGQTFRYTLLEDEAKRTMAEFMKGRGTPITFAHSGGVTHYKVGEIIAMNIHGNSIPHSKSLTKDIETMVLRML